LDKSRKETAHAYPNFMPDGKHYFFLARSSDPQRATAAYVGELGSKERVSLPGIASEAKYSAAPKEGYLVFIRDGALMAQPFNANRLATSGEAFPLADAFADARSAASGPFSVSASGGLAYLRPFNASGGAIPNTQFAWFDRKGKQLALAGPPGPYIFGSIGELLRTLVKGELRLSGFPELSPDGKFVAFSRDVPSDIWILDIEKSLTSRLTSDPAEDSFPVWSPDGRTIAFRSTRDGLGNLYTRAVGAVEEDKPLLKDESSKYPSDWSRDGKYIAYFTSTGDLWALQVSGNSGERKPLRVTQTKFNESDAKFSPDGRWIAYVSNEPGQPQVYIQSFPEPGYKQQVSTAGGIMPRWSHDGKELFYIEMPNLMAVSVKEAGSSLQISTPASLFSLRIPLLDNVAADGRFLSFSSLASSGSTTTTQASPAHIIVIQNWAATAPKRK
jgi:hypothetical protein